MSLSVPAGGLEVALSELTYYHQWLNISAALGNNRVIDSHTIPDEYYTVCELNEEAFQPLNAEFHLHTPSGRLRLSTEKPLVLNRELNSLGSLKSHSNPAKHTLHLSHTSLLSTGRSACTSLR